MIAAADIMGADANNAGLWLELDRRRAAQGRARLLGVLIQGMIRTYINFDGTLSNWWTRITTGILLFAFIAYQQGPVALARRPVAARAGAAS